MKESARFQDHRTSKPANYYHPTNNGASTILVVEDDEMVCALVREVLVSSGYGVISAHDGHEAMGIVKSYCGSLDLLLSDIVLPQISGKQLSESATAIRPSMKTVYMSGYPESALQNFGWPNLPYLQKPFTPEELTRKVRQALSATANGLVNPCAGGDLMFTLDARRTKPEKGGQCDKGLDSRR